MNNFKNISIIAPHPDDEILGCGGTIRRLTDTGSRVRILFVSGHLPQFIRKVILIKLKKKQSKHLMLLELNQRIFISLKYLLQR